MYDIKLGQGCGIKATMLTPAGGVCDLRRARYIAATLLLPSNRTMNCADISFNEVTNAVYVRLLGTRELTTPGRYGIVFNVKLEDKTMYSTPAIYFADVSSDAATGYHELTLSLSLTVVNFTENVSYTGASPKISDKNTWLVYDDNLNAYVDTGVEVGYANLLSRYDGKFAEIVVPCTEVTNAAAAATVAANNAATAANTEAGKATTATAAANTAAGKANAATTAANNAATAANTAAEETNDAVKAALAAAAAALEAAAAAAPVVVNVEGAAAAIDVQPNHIYKCGELTSLNIRSVADSPQIAEVIFTSGATATELTMPNTLADNVTGWKIPQANKTYKIFFQSNTATISY